MKASPLTIMFVFSLRLVALGQWHDNNWILGYDQEHNESLSETFMMSFDSSSLGIKQFPVKLDFLVTNITVNDEAGNLLFYSNGIQIHDKNDKLMLGGDSLNAGEVAYVNWQYGYTLSRGIMCLPAPGNSSQYYLIHRKLEYNDSTGINVPDILYTLVDMSLNNGKGTVVSKNNLVKKIFWTDDSAATKHANGRDWWVLTPDHRQNKIYSFRVMPDGIADTTTQAIGYMPLAIDSTDSGGQNIFSPDGSVFVDFDARNGVRIYDFDRCTGELSNFRWVPLPYESVILMSFGAAISPNSRFLYFSRAKYILQLDLWGGDIGSSLDTVAVYEGWVPGQPPGFRDMMPTPDGKIFIFDFLKQIHVINKPNEKGSACDVRQGYISLPDYPAGSAYYPNYRLGPLDGSACDTFGLDNHPLARFNWEVADTMNPLQVEFTDNSFYEPTEWFWDFGGTGTSTEVNPLYDFPADGTYTVCLTVSNQYDSDTFCREVTVGVTGTKEEKETAIFKVSPNPANGAITVEYAIPAEWKNAGFVLLNSMGNKAGAWPLDAAVGKLKIDTPDLAPGVYFLQILSDAGKSSPEKLIILK